MVWVAMLLGTVVYADQPRLIVNVVTPDGVLSVVPGRTAGRWGIPAGKSGSYDKAIVLEEVDAVSFRIGDRVNPQLSARLQWSQWAQSPDDLSASAAGPGGLLRGL